MGLISRASSRTYRKNAMLRPISRIVTSQLCCKFSASASQLNKNQADDSDKRIKRLIEIINLLDKFKNPGLNKQVSQKWRDCIEVELILKIYVSPIHEILLRMFIKLLRNKMR